MRLTPSIPRIPTQGLLNRPAIARYFRPSAVGILVVQDSFQRATRNGVRRLQDRPKRDSLDGGVAIAGRPGLNAAQTPVGPLDQWRDVSRLGECRKLLRDKVVTDQRVSQIVRAVQLGGILEERMKFLDRKFRRVGIQGMNLKP